MSIQQSTSIRKLIIYAVAIEVSIFFIGEVIGFTLLPEWEDGNSVDSIWFQNWLIFSSIIVPIYVTIIFLRNTKVKRKFTVGLISVIVTIIIVIIIASAFLDLFHSQYMEEYGITKPHLPIEVNAQLFAIIIPIKIFVPIIISKIAES